MIHDNSPSITLELLHNPWSVKTTTIYENPQAST